MTTTYTRTQATMNAFAARVCGIKAITQAEWIEADIEANVDKAARAQKHDEHMALVAQVNADSKAGGSMKNCTHCELASWKTTSAGKLHPSGDGKCQYVFVPPVLPGSMYWIGGTPMPAGGAINRRDDLIEHCPRYAPKESL